MQHKNILITRPGLAGKKLCQTLESVGVKTVYFPTLLIESVKIDLTSSTNLLKIANIIIFISASAVHYAYEAGLLNNLGKAEIAVIGEATAAALKKLDIKVDICPHEFNSEGLLRHDLLQSVCAKKIVIIRGQGGREFLANALKEQGATVDYLEVYKREKPDMKVTKMILDSIDIILMTSQEAFLNLLLMTPSSLKSLLMTKEFLVSSQSLKEYVEHQGFKVRMPLLKSAALFDILNWFKFVGRY